MMKDTNKAKACISSSTKGESVYFKDNKSYEAFKEEYIKLVKKYNEMYHKD